jgi:hypothetical protein
MDLINIGFLIEFVTGADKLLSDIPRQIIDGNFIGQNPVCRQGFLIHSQRLSS